MIRFICSAPVKEVFDGLSVYESFDLVSTGNKNAPLSQASQESLNSHQFNFDIKKISKIYTAPSGQTYESGRLIIRTHTPHAILKTTPALNNIRFKMSELLSRDDFESTPYIEAANLARLRFIEKFADDKLSESKMTFEVRIHNFLKQLSTQKEETLCIGHAFFLKILEIYIKNKNLLQSKEEFIKAFDPSRRPFAPLQGFSVSEKQIKRCLQA